MGFFCKLFGRDKDLDVLDDSISCLRLGIFSYLFKKNYVLNTFYICGSNDIKACIVKIDHFAKDFLNKITKISN